MLEYVGLIGVIINAVTVGGGVIWFVARIKAAAELQRAATTNQERAFQTALKNQAAAFKASQEALAETLRALAATVRHLDGKLDDHATRIARVETKLEA